MEVRTYFSLIRKSRRFYITYQKMKEIGPIPRKLRFFRPGHPTQRYTNTDTWCPRSRLELELRNTRTSARTEPLADGRCGFAVQPGALSTPFLRKFRSNWQLKILRYFLSAGRVSIRRHWHYIVGYILKFDVAFRKCHLVTSTFYYMILKWLGSMRTQRRFGPNLNIPKYLYIYIENIKYKYS